MANHVWTVLCEKTVVDSETERATLRDVIEGMQIDATQPPKGSTITVNCQMDVVSLCIRSNMNEPEEGVLLYSIEYPSGELSDPQPAKYQLVTHTKCRSILRTSALPIGEPGVYWFVVAFEGSDEVVARVPLEVSFVEDSGDGNEGGSERK